MSYDTTIYWRTQVNPWNLQFNFLFRFERESFINLKTCGKDKLISAH